MSSTDTATEPKQNPRGGAPKGNLNARKHGFHSAKKALSEFGQRAIDGRSAMGRALADSQADLERDLGGDLSAQKSTIVELACRTRLLVDGCDAFIMQNGAISKRKRALYPIVMQRQQLADALARYLSMLGLERAPKPTPSLADYMRERAQSEQVPESKAEPLAASPAQPNALEPTTQRRATNGRFSSAEAEQVDDSTAEPA